MEQYEILSDAEFDNFWGSFLIATRIREDYGRRLPIVLAKRPWSLFARIQEETLGIIGPFDTARYDSLVAYTWRLVNGWGLLPKHFC